ncbi:MAG: hypothetical protein LBD69_02865 [Puniceicoccales bacterium]|nr:hypothetical protein [Puniceicoccales bacterium]
MKAFKLLSCLFLGIHAFSCFGESTHYTLHMNEESRSFFEKLREKYLVYGQSEIDLFYIEQMKNEYGPHRPYVMIAFFNHVGSYLEHNDRDHKDCYQMAFWLVFLCENKIPMGESTTQEISNFLNLFEEDLQNLCLDLQYADVEQAIKGITFQSIQSKPKQKQCLLL